MTRYCLALIAVLATTDARVSAIELIENGSFEADGFGPIGSIGWTDSAGVENDVGFGVPGSGKAAT